GTVAFSIQKSAQANFLVASTNNFYNLVVTNTGTVASSGNIVVTDTLPTAAANPDLPANFTMVTGGGSGFACQAPGANAITCTPKEAMPPGETATITVQVQTPNTLNNGKTSITVLNQATLANSSDPGSPRLSNNLGTVISTQPLPDLQITKAASGS